MTAEELEAIIEGIAPVVKAMRDRLTREIDTLRTAQLALRDQVIAAETRSAALETRLLEQQKADLEVRCRDLEVRLIAAVTPRGVPDVVIR